MMIFRTNLKQLREDKGYSQQYMAGELGITKPMYNYWEVRANNIREKIAIAICEVLNTTMENMTNKNTHSTLLSEVTAVRNFWENIENKRENMGLSQKDFIDLLGITISAYQARKGNKYKLPSDRFILKLSEVLKCDPLILKNNNCRPISQRSNYISYNIGKLTINDEKFNKVRQNVKEIMDSLPPRDYSGIPKARAFNDVRDMAIELLEASCGNTQTTDYTRYIPRLMERGIIEEHIQGSYRLTQKYADPR